jgi:benzylsuccinate CoA-transferase BbsF subunit
LALHCRERTGRGQHIDYSQLEGIIQLVGPAFIDYLLNGRIERIDTIHERLAEWTRQFGDYELAERLQGFGVAATPVLDVSDLLEDAHYRARGTFIRVVHPLGFEETIYGAYVKTSRSEPDIRPGPAVGQDNEQVFKELLGMPEARYRELVERKVIF